MLAGSLIKNSRALESGGWFLRGKPAPFELQHRRAGSFRRGNDPGGAGMASLNAREGPREIALDDTLCFDITCSNHLMVSPPLRGSNPYPCGSLTYRITLIVGQRGGFCQHLYQHFSFAESPFSIRAEPMAKSAAGSARVPAAGHNLKPSPRSLKRGYCGGERCPAGALPNAPFSGGFWTRKSRIFGFFQAFRHDSTDLVMSLILGQKWVDKRLDCLL